MRFVLQYIQCGIPVTHLGARNHSVGGPTENHVGQTRNNLLGDKMILQTLQFFYPFLNDSSLWPNEQNERKISLALSSTFLLVELSTHTVSLTVKGYYSASQGTRAYTQS